MTKTVRSKFKKPAKIKKPKLTEKAKRYLYTNPTTKNQRKWNKEIERISRFEKRHKGIEVKYPEKPTRISQKDLRSIQKYIGKAILEQSTVKLSPERIAEYGTYEVSALEFLKLETQSDKLKENETAFNKALRKNLSEYELEKEHLANYFDVEQDTVSDNFEDYLREYHEDMGYPEPTEMSEFEAESPDRIYDWFKGDKEHIDEPEDEEEDYPPFELDGIIMATLESVEKFDRNFQIIVYDILEKTANEITSLEVAKSLIDMNNQGYTIETAIMSSDEEDALQMWFTHFIHNMPIADEDKERLLEWYNDEMHERAIEAYSLRRARNATGRKMRDYWQGRYDEYD